MISPILCYNAEIWGYEYCESIERVQLKFCKQILRLNSSTATPAVLGELGRLPLCTSYMKRCVKYFTKLLVMDNSRYPKACYNMLLELDIAGRTTWVTHVKSLLFSFGFGYVWVSQEVGHIGKFINMFTQRVQDCYFQVWCSNRNDSRKLSTYSQFKSLLQPEKYLACVVKKHCMYALCRLRTSSHRLEIELGRRNNIERQFRFCRLCLKQNVFVIEDEFHFLLVCPCYIVLRSKHCLQNIPMTSHGFKMLMTTQNDLLLNNLAAFVYEAFKVRDALLI